jgi:hypothetical protein
VQELQQQLQSSVRVTFTFPQKLGGGLSWDRSYLLPLIQLTRTLELEYIHRLWEPVQSDTISKRPNIVGFFTFMMNL